MMVIWHNTLINGQILKQFVTSRLLAKYLHVVIMVATVMSMVHHVPLQVLAVRLGVRVGRPVDHRFSMEELVLFEALMMGHALRV